MRRAHGGHAALCPPYGTCAPEPAPLLAHYCRIKREDFIMGRYLLLWLLGVPIPILILIYAFGGLH